MSGSIDLVKGEDRSEQPKIEREEFEVVENLKKTEKKKMVLEGRRLLKKSKSEAEEKV